MIVALRGRLERCSVVGNPPPDSSGTTTTTTNTTTTTTKQELEGTTQRTEESKSESGGDETTVPITTPGTNPSTSTAAPTGTSSASGSSSSSHKWKWTGYWAFGTHLTADQVQAHEATASSSWPAYPRTTSPQTPQLYAFTYTWNAAVDPFDVQVPSEQQAYQDYQQQQQAAKEQAAAKDETEATQPEGNNNSKKKKEKSEQHTVDMTESTTTKSTTSTTSKPPTVSTFADHGFTDASTKHHEECPTGGQWVGHFETAPTTTTLGAGRRSSLTASSLLGNAATPTTSALPQIAESFSLFLNATPPKQAPIQFGTPPAEPCAVTPPNEPPAPFYLPSSGYIHARGTGTNQYGTFELIGSLELATGLLHLQKWYVQTPMTSTMTSRSSSVSRRSPRGRGRRTVRLSVGGTSSSMTANPLSNTATASDAASTGAPLLRGTRKRQLSWKRRSMMEESTSIATTTPTSTDPNVTAVPSNATTTTTTNMGGGTTTTDAASSHNKRMRSSKHPRTSSMSTASVSTNEFAMLDASMDLSNRSADDPEGTTTLMQVEGMARVVGGDAGDATPRMVIATDGSVSAPPAPPPPLSIPGRSQSQAAPQPSPRGEGSKRTKSSSSRRGSSSGGGGVATILSSNTNQQNSNNNNTRGPVIELPLVGDPLKARWRGAHFLYYHKSSTPATEDAVGSQTSTTNSTNPSTGGTATNTAVSSSSSAAATIKSVVYEGELLQGQRHGRGVCLYDNNLIYEGEWQFDKEHGHGQLCTGDRKRILYEGDWERGKIQGRGIYYYYNNNNNTTAGDALPHEATTGGKRKKSMSGTTTTTTTTTTPGITGLSGNNNSSITSGGRSTASTTGPMRSACRYEGEFRENLRHGSGIYVLPNGSVYDGQWRDGTMNGRGIFRWPDGESVYDGEWKDGKRHGQGLLRAANGFLYDGNWVYNTMEGRGSATYPNGQQYHGMFSHGKRDGRGTIIFPNGGAVYEGRFRNDAVDGQGTMKIHQAVVVVPRDEDDEDPYSGKSEDQRAGGEGVQVVNQETRQGKTTTERPLDFMIPVSFQSDMGHIHRKAGFTVGGK